MQVTVMLKPEVLVEYDGDTQWRSVESPLNVLRKSPVFFRIAISDALPHGSASDAAIHHEVGYLVKDLAKYFQTEEYKALLVDQLRALHGRKAMVHGGS